MNNCAHTICRTTEPCRYGRPGTTDAEARDMPALNGAVVTERHARFCRENGHAVHTIDGVPSPWCPRCGETTGPILGPIKRINGLAGQYAYSVTVTYPESVPVKAAFIASIYGGPIAFMLDGGRISSGFVSRDVIDRIGATLNEEWVRAFYA